MSQLIIRTASRLSGTSLVVRFVIFGEYQRVPIKDIMENGIFSDNYFDDPQVRARFQTWLNERSMLDQLLVH